MKNLQTKRRWWLIAAFLAVLFVAGCTGGGNGAPSVTANQDAPGATPDPGPPAPPDAPPPPRRPRSTVA